ncbi:DUF1573 domain-containing protein [Nonlabens xiamenensis]|uniref:DUF1573 domain-containing protein n=1 Tax=Nonlabens xiamenensis TaxID=2341043 RepID=UPI0013DDF462|nr:DUF1573 domain-containing protein [Nonlabens xiamenensis]
MKNVLLILALMVLSFGAQAQEKKSLDPLTTISFDTRTMDYGTITKNSDGIRSFKFTNTGENPLKIYRIYSSCSCDIVSQPEEPIAPGASSEIKVKYDTMKVGPIVKTITVYANIEDKLVPLRMKGKVVDP